MIVKQSYPVLSQPDAQSAITVWATVMSYIVNFEPREVMSYKNKINKAKNNRHTAAALKKDSVLRLNPVKYIYKKGNEKHRKYTKPDFEFSVRGHYRYYCL